MQKPTFQQKQSTLFGRKKYLLENLTHSEQRITNLLDEAGIYYMPQKGFIAGDYYCIVDFYFPKVKICLEIDGGYHNTQEQQARDSRKDSYLVSTRGMRVVRITNEEANIITAEALVSTLFG